MTLAALGPPASCWEPCCTAWRLRRLTHVCGAWSQRRLAPAALGNCGAWRLRCLAPFSVWVAIETFRGLQRPPEAQMSPKSVFSGCRQSDIIAIYYFWAHWTLPTCSICYTQLLVLPLSVWFGLSRPLEASRGPYEHQISVFGMSPE